MLGVSESGYYAWRKREPSQHKQEDEQLAKLIEDAYHNNRQVYESPRVHAELKAQGVQCGRKWIARLMREGGISAKAKRCKMKTTDSHHDNPVAPNLLKRDFTADAPNRKWVADITGIGTRDRMVVSGSHCRYLLPVRRWMGDEQGTRRAIGDKSGRNGTHSTQMKS